MWVTHVEFHMEIEYCRGKDNIVAYSLSSVVYEMNFSIVKSEALCAIPEAQKGLIICEWFAASP